MGGDIVVFGLGINGKHPNLVRAIPDVVDHPDTPALSGFSPLPTELSYSSGARDHVSSFRMLHEKPLQIGILVVIQVNRKFTLKNAGFDNVNTGSIYA
jgi:hypothetical protein